jgi:ACT domain-containing protein
MKNFTLAIAILFLMASFSVNLTNNTVMVLTDIEGTLLEEAPVIENNDGDFTVTFTVDENVIISSALIGESNEIFLVENGNSEQSKTVTLGLQEVNGKVSTAFNNIYENNYDVATIDAMLSLSEPDKRPSGAIIWD